jgi:hypothetical protein
MPKMIERPKLTSLYHRRQNSLRFSLMAFMIGSLVDLTSPILQSEKSCQWSELDFLYNPQ